MFLDQLCLRVHLLALLLDGPYGGEKKTALRRVRYCLAILPSYCYVGNTRRVTYVGGDVVYFGTTKRTAKTRAVLGQYCGLQIRCSFWDF